MTKGELFEILKDIPDNAEINVYDGCNSVCLSSDIIEIWYDKEENTVLLDGGGLDSIQDRKKYKEKLLTCNRKSSYYK